MRYIESLRASARVFFLDLPRAVRYRKNLFGIFPELYGVICGLIKAGLIAVFFCGVSCPRACAGEIVLTLDEALLTALKDNRQLAQGKAKEEAARAGVSLANSAVLPTVDISGTLEMTRGLYSKDVGELSEQVSVRQYLYKGGAISAAMRKSKFNLSAAQASLSRDKQEVLLKVKKSFFTLVLAERYRRLSRFIAVSAKRHLDYVSELHRRGQASESEIIGQRSSLRSAMYLYSSAATQKKSAGEILANLLYLKSGDEITAAGRLRYAFRDTAYDAAFLKAAASRPELRLYEAEERSAEEAVKIARGFGRPSLKATLDYYSSNRLASGTEKNDNDHSVAGLTVSWPVFDGGQARAEVEAAIAALKASQAQRQQVIKDIATELRQACLGLQDSLEALKAAEEEVKVYRDNLRAAQEKYRRGIASLLDMQDAALKYETAYFKKEQAVYAYMIAGMDFDKAIGGV